MKVAIAGLGRRAFFGEDRRRPADLGFDYAAVIPSALVERLDELRVFKTP
jgi:hypothetical protein